MVSGGTEKAKESKRWLSGGSRVGGLGPSRPVS